MNKRMFLKITYSNKRFLKTLFQRLTAKEKLIANLATYKQGIVIEKTFEYS